MFISFAIMKLFKDKVLNISNMVDLNQMHIKVVSRFITKKMFTKTLQKLLEKTHESAFLFSEVAGLQVLLHGYFRINIFFIKHLLAIVYVIYFQVMKVLLWTFYLIMSYQ